MLRDDEYLRLQATFLAIAKHSDHPLERARWLALVHACQESITDFWRDARSKLHSHAQRAA